MGQRRHRLGPAHPEEARHPGDVAGGQRPGIHVAGLPVGGGDGEHLGDAGHPGRDGGHEDAGRVAGGAAGNVEPDPGERTRHLAQPRTEPVAVDGDHRIGLPPVEGLDAGRGGLQCGAPGHGEGTPRRSEVAGTGHQVRRRLRRPAVEAAPGFKLHEPNNRDIAPRLGATYRLTDKTILRGGWGIYFNPNQMNTFTFLTNNPPIGPRSLQQRSEQPDALVRQPDRRRDHGAPDIITPNRDLPNAWKNQWSVDIQQELWPSTVVEFQYLASRTKNLDRSYYVNTPQPGAGAIEPRRPNPMFRQDPDDPERRDRQLRSLAVVLRRRMTDGLAFNAHYTWSRPAT